TLTDHQRRQWTDDGYLVIEGALDDDEVAFFNDELDRVRLEPGWEPDVDVLGHYAWLDHAASTSPEGFMDRRDLLGYGQHFIDLIDRPGIFDLIVELMGPHIMLSMTQAIVRPSTDKFAGYTHTDGGEGLREIRVTETSRPIAMKAMYLLTDVAGHDTGGFTVFPGSHRREFPWRDETARVNPHSDGAQQLEGKAGDCYLFPHALWHGPAPNHSGRPRKTLLYNYCQLFVRSYDHELTPEVDGALSPRQRRLLGDLGYRFRPGSYFYVPQDQEAVIYGEAGAPSAGGR
ncbi:MAG: phytanoyl-CoA dioxygenase family protein, partial [Acidimicrobiia bacterium]|nr:phytanoyl-CoA dioxygenase family protein [Acidimicrobiia bacterium]